MEIFLTRIEQDENLRRVNSDLDGQWGNCDAPLVLGSVCAKWRRIVMSEPSLWQFFNVSMPLYVQKFASNQQENPFIFRLKIWAEKSGDKPLNVAVRGIGDETDFGGSKAAVMIRQIFGKLGNRMNRLQMLFKGDTSVAQVLAPYITGTLPDLQHLVLHVAESVMQRKTYVPVGAFSASMALETLQLRNIWWEKDLSFAKLRLFDVYNPEWRISPQQLLGVIGRCKELREMPIEFEYKPINVNPSNNLNVTDTVVTLEHLESLQTTCEWISLAAAVLSQTLIAPRLVKLQLYGCGDVQAISQFIEHCSPNLECLNLGITSPQGEDLDIDLIPLLRAAPKLTEFGVDSVAITASFLDALAATDKPNCPGMMLQSLVMKNVHFPDPDALLRMVAARTKTGLDGITRPRRLLTLEIPAETRISPWHEQQIDEMMLLRDHPTEKFEIQGGHDASGNYTETIRPLTPAMGDNVQA
jgi:hypothetical protein